MKKIKKPRKKLGKLITWISVALGIIIGIYSLPKMTAEIIRLIKGKPSQQQRIERKLNEFEESFHKFEKEFQVYIDGLPEVTDITKRNILKTAMAAMDKFDYENAIQYFKKYLELSLRDDERCAVLNLIALSYQQIAVYHNKKNALLLSKNAYLEMISIAKRITDDEALSKGSGSLSVIYSISGEFQKALEYGRLSLEIYKKIEDDNGIARALGQLGMIYLSMNNNQKALEYLEQSLSLVRNRFLFAEALQLINIGFYYYRNREYRKALEYYRQALKICEEENLLTLKANPLESIGNIHMKFGEYKMRLSEFKEAEEYYKEAEGYYKRALEINKKTEDYPRKAEDLKSLGSIYLVLGNREKSLEYYNQALEVNKKIEDWERVIINLEQIARVYIHQKKYKDALNYLKQAKKICEESGLDDRIEIIDEKISKVSKETRR